MLNKLGVTLLLFALLCINPNRCFTVNAEVNVPQPTARLNCNKVVVAQVGKSKPKSVYKLKEKTAIFFRGDLAVDADGAPKAYHPTDDKIALDYKANGFPWAVVRVDGKPWIQGPNDPAPGYYVSKTSLEDKTKNETDPLRYVNAEEIPYIVLPPVVKKKCEIKLGDLAVVINKQKGKSSYAIFADIGPKDKLGEGSIALANALEVKKNPKTGGPSVKLIYIVFPGSGDGKPKSLEEINSKGAELFMAWGGMEQVSACFPDE